MPLIGTLFLWIALALSTFAVFAPLINKEYLKHAYNAVYGVAALMTASISILAFSMLTSDFRLTYVAEYSNKALGWVYKLSAVYAGQAGSLLFWGWLIAVFAAIVVFVNRDKISEYNSYLISVLASVIWFFLFLITAAPFIYDIGISSEMRMFLNFILLALAGAAIVWSVVSAKNKSEQGESFAGIVYIGLASVTMILLFRMGVINTMAVGTNPFELLGTTLADGQGLNPLLQNYGMITHPPTLFLGFAGFTVPFAYAMAALFTKENDGSWLKQSRLWLIFSWLLLGIGIVLGAQWAYMELGWGGYWAWDPVENASLMPWLVGTALVHSALAQRRKNLFKIWNVYLVTFTFILCIFGTYLTRSGVVSSVHSFGESPLGNFILLYIVAALGGSLVLIFSRLKEMKPERQIENYDSKEFMFLATNVLLTIATVIVFYGTDYPLIAKLLKDALEFLRIPLPAALASIQQVGNESVQVGVEFYEALMGPLTLVLFAVMAACPLIAWKKTNLNKLLVPFSYMGGIVVIILPLWAFGVIDHPLATAGFAVLAMMGTVSGYQIYKSVWKKSKINWDRVGAYIIHLGIALTFIGIIASSVFEVSKNVTLSAGETFQMRGYTFKYEGPETDTNDLRQSNRAIVTLWKGDTQLSALTTSLDTFFSSRQDQTVTEPGLYYNLKEDVYVAVTNLEDGGQTASFKMFHNPLVIWFWIGSIIITLGGLVLLGADYLPRSAIAKTTRKLPLEANAAQAQISCGKCGSLYNKDDKFCKQCGAKAGGNNVCSCGAQKKKDAKFCVSCGRRY